MQQEEEADLQPVLQWVGSGQKPPWNEVAGCSPATKGLYAKFDALQSRVDGFPSTERVNAKGLSWNYQSRTLWSLKNPASIFYWGQLQRDVEDFCHRCDSCTAHKGPPDQSQTQLQQLAVGAPMERVAMDIMGPFPCVNKGNSYILTAMDYFMKWPEAYAILDQKAKTVADVGYVCQVQGS